MAGIFSDALRAPNTQYILSLSYGKDSIACFEAIYRLGLPLDRAVHAEVWATDDIPADLPPMIEFKSHADQIILDRYGIKVEHICTTKPVERERESHLRARILSNTLLKQIRQRTNIRLSVCQRRLVQLAA